MRKKFYARLQQGLPAVLVAASWAALWLLWPRPAWEDVPTRLPSAAAVVYASAPRSPSPFGWGSAFAGPWKEPGRLAEKKPLDLAAFQPATDRPYFLARAPRAQPGPDRSLLHAIDAAVRRAPADQAGPPLDPPPAPHERARARPPYRISPTLQAAEFELTEEALEPLRAVEEHATVRLQVMVGARGRVEHVFVEQSSGHRELDRLAVQAALRGRVAYGRAAGWGWITLYGGVP